MGAINKVQEMAILLVTEIGYSNLIDIEQADRDRARAAIRLNDEAVRNTNAIYDNWLDHITAPDIALESMIKAQLQKVLERLPEREARAISDKFEKEVKIWKQGHKKEDLNFKQQFNKIGAVEGKAVEWKIEHEFRLKNAETGYSRDQVQLRQELIEKYKIPENRAKAVNEYQGNRKGVENRVEQAERDYRLEKDMEIDAKYGTRPVILPSYMNKKGS